MTKAEEFAASDKLWPDGPWFEYGLGDPQTYKGTIVGRARVVCFSDLAKEPIPPYIDALVDDMMARLTQTIQKMDDIEWLKFDDKEGRRQK